MPPFFWQILALQYISIFFCDTAELQKTYAEKYDTLIVHWKAQLADKIMSILEHPFYVYRAEKNTYPKYVLNAAFLYDERLLQSLNHQQFKEACKEVGIEVQNKGLDLIELYNMIHN